MNQFNSASQKWDPVDGVQGWGECKGCTVLSKCGSHQYITPLTVLHINLQSKLYVSEKERERQKHRRYLPKLVTKHISNQLGSKLTAFLEFCRNMQLQIDMQHNVSKASKNVAQPLFRLN